MSDHDMEELGRLVSRAAGCHGLVTRDGEQDACEKPAVAIVDGRGTEDEGYWPACAYHANRYGPAVPIEDIYWACRGGSIAIHEWMPR